MSIFQKLQLCSCLHWSVTYNHYYWIVIRWQNTDIWCHFQPAGPYHCILETFENYSLCMFTPSSTAVHPHPAIWSSCSTNHSIKYSSSCKTFLVGCSAITDYWLITNTYQFSVTENIIAILNIHPHITVSVLEGLLASNSSTAVKHALQITTEKVNVHILVLLNTVKQYSTPRLRTITLIYTIHPLFTHNY